MAQIARSLAHSGTPRTQLLSIQYLRGLAALSVLVPLTLALQKAKPAPALARTAKVTRKATAPNLPGRVLSFDRNRFHHEDDDVMPALPRPPGRPVNCAPC